MEFDELVDAAPDLTQTRARVLIVALTGFVDAGGAGRLAVEHLHATRETNLVATFRLDTLYDYRARRPPMLFDEDHWERYDEPRLAVHLVYDAVGTPFLTLTGPEPDFRWEAFVGAARELMRRVDATLSVNLNAIPMAVPHTRPIGVTAHASRPELIAGHEPWLQRVQVPGAAAHLLEFRRGRDGEDAIGFAAHVPHYLSDNDYPAAAERLLVAVTGATGLVLPTEELHVAAEEVRRQVDEQVAASEDVQAVVRGLEEQYDAYVRGTGRDMLGVPNGPLPTAEELGAELERFLAEQQQEPGDPGT